jgi:hypothetical protein
MILFLVSKFFSLHCQNISSRDTFYIDYESNIEFDNLIGYISSCIVESSGENFVLFPFKEGGCSSIEEYFYFNNKDREIQRAHIIDLPSKLKKDYSFRTFYSIPNKQLKIWTGWNDYIIVTDENNNYKFHKKFNIQKGQYPVFSRHEFVLNESLFFPYFSLNKNNNSKVYNSAFRSIEIDDIVYERRKRVKNWHYVPAFPCNFQKSLPFMVDRSFYPDFENNTVWFFNNYRSQLTEYDPKSYNFLNCYNLPNELILNGKRWEIFDSISFSIEDAPGRSYDRMIFNPENPNAKSYISLGTFQVLNNGKPILYHGSIIFSNDTALVDNLKKCANLDAANITLVNTYYKGMYYFLIEEYIQLEVNPKIIRRLISPGLGSSSTTTVTFDYIEKFEMIETEKDIFKPAIIKFNLASPSVCD